MRICFHILYSGLLDPKGCYKRGRATRELKSSPPQPLCGSVPPCLSVHVSKTQGRHWGEDGRGAWRLGRAVGSWHTWLPSPSVQLGRRVGLPGALYTQVPRTGSNGSVYFFYSPEDGRPRCWQCRFPPRSLSLAHRRLSPPESSRALPSVRVSVPVSSWEVRTRVRLDSSPSYGARLT